MIIRDFHAAGPFWLRKIPSDADNEAEYQEDVYAV